MITREVDFCSGTTKLQEGNNTSDVKVNPPSKTAAVFSSRPTTSSSSWTRLKDPRIVRVSRALGGKDRHSKVCTVRGLRDRRVRLSVPTAIQLYDLQDRLGLNQPSKVVDWLLDAAKHDIDQLPPLQMPPIIFDPYLHPLPTSSNAASASSKGDAAPSFNSFLRWDPSNHHHGAGVPVPKPEDHFHNFNNVVYSSSLPPGLQQYSIFHPQSIPPAAPEFDLKQMINFQMLMSSGSQHALSTSLRPAPIDSINHQSVVKPMHFLHSHHSGTEPDKKNNEFM